MSLTLDFKASVEHSAPRELVEIAVLAEKHGTQSVTVSDHFQMWRHTDGRAPFSLTWMAAAGERTERIRIGTSILTPTFQYNPVLLASAFATMEALCPGRIVLGVGTVEALHEFATGFRGASDALSIEEIASRWILRSDPGAVVAEFGKHVVAGLNPLVTYAPRGEQRRFLELFACDLSTRLRALA